MQTGLPAGTLSGRPQPSHLKFGPSAGFQSQLRLRVDRYFEATGQRRRDCPWMYLKTLLIFAWLIGSYAALLMSATWWLAVPLSISLGLAMAAVGFNIMHDGGHHAYSERPWINKLMALSLDLLGGSSFVWARKHNVIHHSYTNITGHDDDINIGVLGRLSPHQKRFRFHQLQQYYLWALYGLLPTKWQIYDDFRDVLLGRCGEHRMARPRGWNLATFLIGKIVFCTLVLAVPMLFHSFGAVLLCYLLASWVQGLAMSIVFQLAHCVEGAAFPMPLDSSARIDAAWAVHQVETTVNFAPRNRLLTWYVGGLNFQIEHHLFPRICHIHYPALAPLVEETCREFGVKYQTKHHFRAAVASHFRWLRRMGKPDPIPSPG